MISRRTFLKTTTAMAALAAVPSIPRAFAASDPYMTLDATAQAELVRKGDVSALELLDASIARIEKLNPTLNAVVTTSYDQAREIAKAGAPDGPFSGVPYAVKDLSDQAGVRSTKGSKLFLEHIAETDSPSIAAQKKLGLISLGKTNTPEFGLLGTTESLALGPCRNPWNPEHSSGGSSGGAASAVASGMVSIASASDGGGSIRIPASSCGLFGLKTSRSRTIAAAPEGAADISVRSVVSRSVRDTATSVFGTQNPSSGLPVLPHLTGPSDRKLKIALNMTSLKGEQPDADVKAAIEATAKLCESMGHTVEEARLDIDGDAFIDAFMTIWANGAYNLVGLATKLAGGKPPQETGLLEPWTIGLADWYAARPADQLETARANFDAVTQASADFFKAYDVTLSPVLRTPAPKIGEQAPDVPFDTLMERTLSYVSYTPLANATGEPAMSVPLGWSSTGLPIGSHFQAALGQEELLLDLAFQLEEAAPWADKWPDISRAL